MLWAQGCPRGIPRRHSLLGFAVSLGHQSTMPGTFQTFHNFQVKGKIFSSPEFNNIALCNPEHYIVIFPKQRPWAFINTLLTSLMRMREFSLPGTLISILFTFSDSFTSLFVVSWMKETRCSSILLVFFFHFQKYTFYFILILLWKRMASVTIKQASWVQLSPGGL